MNDIGIDKVVDEDCLDHHRGAAEDFNIDFDQQIDKDLQGFLAFGERLVRTYRPDAAGQ